MKIIGLTGGIGSGKSTIGRVFSLLGVPVFNSDEVAKKFYTSDPYHPQLIADAFGNDLIADGKVDFSKLAAVVFNDQVALSKLNAMVHPWVRGQFIKWHAKQQAPYLIREAAILIESKSYSDCQHIIQVIAPTALKLERVVRRSGLQQEEILSRMARQLSDEERGKYCDLEILNDDCTLVIPQVLRIHAQVVSELD